MPHTIDDTLFENWIDTFASRIGRELAPHALVALHTAVCRVFDSDDEFHAAAQYVYERWQSWNSWPAPIEFESARAALRRIPDAEIKATYAQYIAPARQIAPPKSEAVTAFSALWRAELTAKGADPASLARERQARRARDFGGDDPWLTDDRRPLDAAATEAA